MVLTNGGFDEAEAALRSVLDPADQGAAGSLQVHHPARS